MTRKSLIILLVIAVATGITALLLKQPDDRVEVTGDLTPGQRLLGEVSVADGLTALDIAGDDGETTLTKQDDDRWVVAQRDGYPADSQRLVNVLRQLDEVKAAQVQQAGPSQHGRLELADPADAEADDDDTGTKVTLRADEKALAALILGKSPESGGLGGFGGSGRFVRLEGTDGQVALVDESFSQLTADPSDWIDKDWLRPGPFKSITVEGPGDFQGWTVHRETESAVWALKDIPEGKRLAGSASSSLNSFLSYASPDDVLTQAEAGEIDQADARTITLETFDNITYTLTVTPMAKEQEEDAEESPATDNPDYAVTLAVSGEYVPPADEEEAPGAADTVSTEDNAEAKAAKEAAEKAREEARKAARKAWDEKLAEARKFTGRTYKMSHFTFTAVWKDRDEIIEDAPEELPADGNIPEVSPGTPIPGVDAPSGPVSVTTPPIAVPPLPSDPQGEEKAGETDEDAVDADVDSPEASRAGVDS